MKKVITVIMLLVLTTVTGKLSPAASAERGAVTTGILSFRYAPADPRTLRLSEYLASNGSPLAPYADIFVREAEKYNLDWRLVAAISGVESTFGIAIPEGSFNGWGWGIPTGAASGIAFGGWEDGITEVSKGLRENYINKGAVTVEQIGRIYAASPSWAWKVHYFLDQIEAYQPKRTEDIKITL